LAIRFFLHLVDFKVEEKRKIKAWIKKILADHKKIYDEINIIITSDSKLLEINKKYLNRNEYTDIITFDYSVENKISGELYISIDRVNENSGIYGITYNKELLRVIIHGILHLMGYDDIKSLEKTRMKKMENQYLEKYYKKGSDNLKLP
jgi:probable rRNA maturation factor